MLASCRRKLTNNWHRITNRNSGQPLSQPRSLVGRLLPRLDPFCPHSIRAGGVHFARRPIPGSVDEPHVIGPAVGADLGLRGLADD